MQHVQEFVNQTSAERERKWDMGTRLTCSGSNEARDKLNRNLPDNTQAYVSAKEPKISGEEAFAAGQQALTFKGNPPV